MSKQSNQRFRKEMDKKDMKKGSMSSSTSNKNQSIQNSYGGVNSDTASNSMESKNTNNN